jgi:hypothetical protein
MERNVVSLETAKRLSAAGFPQEDAYSCWEVIGDVSGVRVNSLLMGKPYKFYAAPTAQEIADKLPKPIAINIYSGGRVSTSHAGEHNFVKSVPKEVNLAEALAALYLKLEEQ